ncbi:MAG: PEP-CTERM sorting domain-containing protein, partial [Phycisphaerae bacterium]
SAYPMTIDTSVGNPAPSANTNFNDAAGISIASANGYIEPAVLTLSADLNMGTIVGGSLSYKVYGVGLGFWNALPASGGTASAGFTGITLDPYGDLTFINDGTASTTAKAAAPSSATVVGGYISGFNTLTYSINTGTGAITQLTFDGTDLTSDFAGATAFTPSVATVAGFYGNNPYSVSENGYVDNFSVATVPEPAALGLMAVGAMGLLLLKRRKTV